MFKKYSKQIFFSIVALAASSFYLTAIGSFSPFISVVVALLLVSMFVFPVSFSFLLFIYVLAFSFPSFRPYSDTLQLWRVLAAALFFRVLLDRFSWFNFKSLWGHEVYQPLLGKLKQLPVWVISLAGLLIVSLFSLLIAPEPKAGLTKIIFILNAGLVGIVMLKIFNKQDINKIIKAVLFLLTTIVGLGYLQYVFATITPIFDFWQYWAEVVARNIFGGELASTLWYSNSWFTVNKGQLVLRMFSIMPDSHSFGLVCVFGIVLFTYLFSTKQIRGRSFIIYQFLFSLALVFSGTRGVWAGMLVPAAVFICIYFIKKDLRSFSKTVLASIGIVVVAFAVTPVIRIGMVYVYNGLAGDVFTRVRSIYDTTESSNAGRIAIWKESLSIAYSHPIGVGFGNFLQARVGGGNNSSLFEKINPRYNLPEKYITAHSLYLQTLIELGFVGLILLILFCLSLLWFLFKEILKKGENAHFYTAMIFMALWLMAFSVFDVTLYNDKILVLVTLFISLIALMQKRQNA